MAGEVSSYRIWSDPALRLRLRIWALSAVPGGPVAAEDLAPFRTAHQPAPIQVNPSQGVLQLAPSLRCNFVVALPHPAGAGPITLVGLALVLPGPPDQLVGLGVLEPSVISPREGFTLLYGCSWYCLTPPGSE